MTGLADPETGEVDNALIRSVRALVLKELDAAELADDSEQAASHFQQAGRLIDAVLHPQHEKAVKHHR